MRRATKKTNKLKPSRIIKLGRINSELVDALKFYADPNTYFAIGFFPDAPCGQFIKDFSDDHGDSESEGHRPGKLARKVLTDSGIDYLDGYHFPYNDIPDMEPFTPEEIERAELEAKAFAEAFAIHKASLTPADKAIK